MIFCEGGDLGEKRHRRAAAVARQFASHQIERLNAVGALIDHGDARIAHELLHAPFGDVAVAAEHLLRQHRVGESDIGEHAFQDRRHQPHVIVGSLAVLGVAGSVRDVALQRGPHHHRARRLVEGADGEQRAAHVGMHDDRIGRLVRRFRAGQRTALQTVLRVSRRVLIGDFRLRQPLHRDAKPGLVHHHEHALHALVFLADQPAGGAVIVHHAGRIAVNAHLVFDRAAGDAVGRAERTVGIDQHLGHHEQRHALDAGGRAFDAGQHQMNDVLGEIVLAGGDENLGAGDLVAAVGLLDCLGAQQTEIGAALRLGEVHGAGPLSRHHLRHEHRLLFGLAVHHQRRRGAHGEAAIHRKRHVGRALEFGDGMRQRHRQALPAIFRRRRQAEPAALGHLLEGILEAVGGGDPAVVMAGAALEIADAIERLQHFLGEFGRFRQNRFPHVGGGVAEAGKIIIPVDLKHVVEQETHVFQRGFVTRHRLLLRQCFGRHRLGKFLQRSNRSVPKKTLDGTTGRKGVLTEPMRQLARRYAARDAPPAEFVPDASFWALPPHSLTRCLP